MKQNYLKTLILTLMMMVGMGAWADLVKTETFENQVSSTSYQDSKIYPESSSNINISWFVEHGSVSTTGFISGTKSLHMRAFYDGGTSSNVWKYVLPYAETRTAIRGLKSISFKAIVSNKSLKMDVYYSIDGISWTQFGTTHTFNNTSVEDVNYTIPNSDDNTRYYIRIAVSSSSSHVEQPSSGGNYTFRIDDVVFTYAEPTSSYTVSFDGNGYSTPATENLTEEAPSEGIILPSCNANSNYLFVGWADAPDATSANIGKSGSIYYPTSNITLYAYCIPTYTLHITQPSDGGNLIVKNGETPLLDGDIVAVGTNLTFEVTDIPRGKRFSRFYFYYDEGQNKYKATNPATFDNLPTEGITSAEVRVTYQDVSQFNITWSVNGVLKTSYVEENKPINFEAPVSVPDGYIFRGWADAEIDGMISNEPSYITSAQATSDITYYAVFAVKTGNGGIASKNSGLSASTTAQVLETGKPITFTNSSNNLYSDPLRVYLNSTLTISSTTYNIRKIILEGNSKDFPITNLVLQDGETGRITKGSQTITWTGSATSVVFVASSAQARVSSITVEYGDFSYTNFCTTFPSADITLNAACTDGNMVYSTYSNESAWIVPANLTVSAIKSGSESQIERVNFATGDVVPANYGVMVAAAEGGNYTVVLTNDDGIDPTDGANLLHPSIEDMISDSKFYRLTMHNGTKIGFWWGAAEGAAFSLGANKAYLAIPNSSAVKAQGLWFGADDDAIKAVEFKAHKAIYDLQGRKVNVAQKGLYIINGKKVVK